MSNFMDPESSLQPGARIEERVVRADTKIPLEILLRLQVWIGSEFSQLGTAIMTDSQSQQYLRVMKTAPHPTLLTSSSSWLVCRVNTSQQVLCTLFAYNNLVIKELNFGLESEKVEEFKDLLISLNNHQTSICAGIPEEKLITWVNRKNVSNILLERFSSKIVFRDRGCNYVMLDTDKADICRNCAMLLSTSSMDLMTDLELDCPVPECDRSFKYQGALDKHILRHNQDDVDDDDDEVQPTSKHMKLEREESVNHIKLEPEVKVTESPNEPAKIQQDDNDFLDRLLSDLDAPLQKRRRKKKKKFKPSTKDFNCSDCGKAFYYQKNLFTHVVEKHGKSIDELPNLATMKEEYDELDVIRRRGRKGGKGKPVVCDECGVSFKFASGLYNHMKRMHGDTEKKQCPHCPKEVKSCTLEQHIREEHGSPRFACQYCGKGFYYRSFMLNHQRLHTGEYKECVCDLCGAVYKSVQVLNRHVRNAHQDLRNHKCEHCDKAFHNKQRLERHINSQHTKAKVWPCPVCGSRYDRKDNLRTHIRKNHSNVVNPDTVELKSVDNDFGHIEQPRIRSKPAEVATINPETGEIERPAARNHNRAANSLDQSVHVAQDLLNLKYGGQGHVREDIKHEMPVITNLPVGHIRVSNNLSMFEQIPQYSVKLERPDIVMTSVAGLHRGGGGVRIIQQGREEGSREEIVTITTPPGLVQGVHHQQIVFNHHQPHI